MNIVHKIVALWLRLRRALTAARKAFAVAWVGVVVEPVAPPEPAVIPVLLPPPPEPVAPAIPPAVVRRAVLQRVRARLTKRPVPPEVLPPPPPRVTTMQKLDGLCADLGCTYTRRKYKVNVIVTLMRGTVRIAEARELSFEAAVENLCGRADTLRGA